MFVDRVEISIKAGNGGHGLVAFRREKYVPNGGPAGGDGGDGGNVIFRVDNNLRTLIDFRYKRKHVALNGDDGGTNRRSGKSAQDLIIGVPPGTIVKEKETGRVLADLTEVGEEYIAGKGGKGGRGNQHFATPTRQAPRFAEGGTKGEEKNVVLELKMMADVGLLGYPNVGKSTLLSVVSKAKPKIADYPFTTLVPNLGVVSFAEGKSFVMADIPGLIEGANEGAGLGHRFLRHVERTKMLLHLLDVSGMTERDPLEDFRTINEELRKHNEILAKRTQLVVLNKVDLAADETTYEELKNTLEKEGYEVFIISAATREGVDDLMNRTVNLLDEIGEVEPIFEAETLQEYVFEDEKGFTVRRENEDFVVEGAFLEKLLDSVNFDDYDSVAFFQRVLKDRGVFEALEEKGIQEGQTVRILDIQFDYIR
ncbi:GTPase ObgE [Alkalibacter rhizosphaerae]|uniref:GTPase Obg n=1 Tax=Alkalibacter rhizosphaerae TaxID=2815577 RepID=A0A975AI60_9FIRM|nr:GTPase ObgE [Alkalibacter rhizosphaerae]QSX08200.1 GTPase ObgE [Alkalibacter rhizosphaerae]